MFTGNGMSQKERVKQMQEIKDTMAKLSPEDQSNKGLSDECTIPKKIINAQNNASNKYDQIRASMKSISDAANQANLTAEISNNMDVTSYFQNIFDKISTIITTVIGSRDNDGTLIKNL